MNILIDNKSGRPIYDQIYSQIKNQIINGALGEDETLPSIRGLAKDLRISFITTKRAYEELEKDGFIYTLPGKGFRSWDDAQYAHLVQKLNLPDRKQFKEFSRGMKMKLGILLSAVNPQTISKVYRPVIFQTGLFYPKKSQLSRQPQGGGGEDA